MVQTLDVILENLQSDKNRLNFLKKIYTPGNTDVADTILNLDSKNLTVLERELEHSRTKGTVDRFEVLAKKVIDFYEIGRAHV